MKIAPELLVSFGRRRTRRGPCGRRSFYPSGEGRENALDATLKIVENNCCDFTVGIWAKSGETPLFPPSIVRYRRFLDF
jgi:hypothetical protein